MSQSSDRVGSPVIPREILSDVALHPWRNLVRHVLAQAGEDVLRGLSSRKRPGDTRGQIRLARKAILREPILLARKAILWLEGPTCREYCDFLGVPHTAILEFLSRPDVQGLLKATFTCDVCGRDMEQSIRAAVRRKSRRHGIRFSQAARLVIFALCAQCSKKTGPGVMFADEERWEALEGLGAGARRKIMGRWVFPPAPSGGRGGRYSSSSLSLSFSSSLSLQEGSR